MNNYKGNFQILSEELFWTENSGLLRYRITVNPLNVNPTKWSNTVKQFVGNSQQIAWVCLTILWGLALKVLRLQNKKEKDNKHGNTLIEQKLLPEYA